eukprot:2703342-Pleurochrysis_carterae.AAC.1
MAPSPLHCTSASCDLATGRASRGKHQRVPLRATRRRCGTECSARPVWGQNAQHALEERNCPRGCLVQLENGDDGLSTASADQALCTCGAWRARARSLEDAS